MKVVVTHTDLRLYWIPRLTRLEQALRHRGDELRVLEIAGAGSPYAFAGEVNQRPPWWRVLFPDRAMEAIAPREAKAALMQALDEESPDVVISGAIAYPSGAGALAWSLRRGRPWIVMDDARRQDVPRAWLNNCVKRCLYSACAAALLPSEPFSEAFAYWGIPRERHSFGVNVVDNEFFASRAAEARRNASAQRASLGLPESYVLGVGRQVPKKNWALLVDAMRDVAARTEGVELTLVLVGDGPERIHLEEQARNCSGVDVRFVPFLSPDRLASVYSLAAVLVLPSTSGETWGLVVNEAMACGTPVVVSDACGCASTLSGREGGGWIFPSGSREGLVGCIREAVFESREVRDVRLRRVQARVAKWGLDRFVQAAEKAISLAVNGDRRTPSPITRGFAAAWPGRYRPV